MTHYSEILYWLRTYAGQGVDDKRAVETFMDCETDERVKSLRGQIYAVSNGKYDERIFKKQLGAARESRHGTYAEWAKMMLLWMAGYKG